MSRQSLSRLGSQKDQGHSKLIRNGTICQYRYQRPLSGCFILWGTKRNSDTALHAFNSTIQRSPPAKRYGSHDCLAGMTNSRQAPETLLLRFSGCVVIALSMIDFSEPDRLLLCKLPLVDDPSKPDASFQSPKTAASFHSGFYGCYLLATDVYST